MGRRVWRNSEWLTEQGWHQVLVPHFGSWSSHLGQHHDWCLQNLQARFDLHMFRVNQLVGYFELDQDAVIFALRWK